MKDKPPDEKRCWHQKFYGDWCGNEAVWQSCGLGNMMDESIWCAEHPPAKAFRRMVCHRPLVIRSDKKPLQ